MRGLGTTFLMAVTALVFVLLYGPLAVPIVSSFFAVGHGAVDWSRPTLSAYAALTGNESVLNALLTTLVVGVGAVVPGWDEGLIDQTLAREYRWETAADTGTTWRIGDGTAAFYNFIYYTVAGFTENDTFRSNQIREGRSLPVAPFRCRQNPLLDAKKSST